MSKGRILYLALADARGHLMRAHLLSRTLADDFDVQVVTTANEGVRFLARLGTPSTVLSEHFRVEFNAQHDMSRARTDRRVLNYLLLPWRGLADLRRLAVLARRADFVVNDSLHPALLTAPALGFPSPVVQVYGENLWHAMASNLDGRAAPWVVRAYRQALEAVRERAFGHIIHTLGSTRVARPHLPRTYVMPPIVARPARTRAQVRRDLGVPDGAPLAAIYLNPHVREPSIAAALEGALRQGGFHLHAVGEGYATRPGWCATDAAFGDVVHAADLFVSGAGMGALELARTSGTPLLVLLGDQPEQERNVADASDRCPSLHLRAVPLGGDLAGAVAEAARILAPGGAAASGQALAAASPHATEAGWRQAFLELLEAARAQARARLGNRALARVRPLLGPGTP
jgi:hypothetical protein